MGKQDTADADVLLRPLVRVAPLLGLSESALRMRVYRRQIPFVRIGRKIYFSQDQIERWIARCSSPATAPTFSSEAAHE